MKDLKDLMDPNNYLGDILPPIFHKAFSHEFLMQRVGDIVEQFKHIESSRFKDELDSLDKVVVTDILNFVLRRCPADWCRFRHREQIQETLKKLD